LEKINGGARMRGVIEAAVHPADYIESKRDVTRAVDYLNSFLDFENLQLQKHGARYRLVSTTGTSVTVGRFGTLDAEYISEQIEKADAKVAVGDYDGAVTNARTLLEALLLDIERKVTGAEPSQEGDILKYYKRVQKFLNLDASQRETNAEVIPDSLRMVLRGLAGCVQGIAEARNKMGDAHARSYKPAKRHAILVVNAAKTIADFLLATLENKKPLN
jgi:hypothetical protein